MIYTYKTKEELEQIWQESAKILCKKSKMFYVEVLSAPTKVITCCMADDGNLFEETSNAGEAGDVLITQIIEKVIENDLVYYENQYIIRWDKFKEIYIDSNSFYITPCLMEEGEESMVFPLEGKTSVETVVQLAENIVFEPSWGGEMKAIAGAFLVREDIGFYCISPVEFSASHEIVDVPRQ